MLEASRNVLVSSISGVVFAAAWWLIIDICAYYPQVLSYYNGVLLIPGVLNTISLIGNSLIPNASLAENFSVTRIIFFHRMAFFFTMAFGFAGTLIAIIFGATASDTQVPLYGKIGIPVANVVLLASNMMFKFATTDGSEERI